MARTIPKSDIPEGEARTVEVDGVVVCVVHTEGKYYAMDGTCPHAGGPLGDGYVNGKTLTCPWHGWQFDVRTGKTPFGPKIKQPVYEVKVEGQDVLVAVV